MLVVARKYWMSKSSYKKNRCKVSLSTMLAIALFGWDCSPDRKRLNLLKSTLYENVKNSVVNDMFLEIDQLRFARYLILCMCVFVKLNQQPMALKVTNWSIVRCQTETILILFKYYQVWLWLHVGRFYQTLLIVVSKV